MLAEIGLVLFKPKHSCYFEIEPLQEIKYWARFYFPLIIEYPEFVLPSSFVFTHFQIDLFFIIWLFCFVLLPQWKQSNSDIGWTKVNTFRKYNSYLIPPRRGFGQCKTCLLWCSHGCVCSDEVMEQQRDSMKNTNCFYFDYPLVRGIRMFCVALDTKLSTQI